MLSSTDLVQAVTADLEKIRETAPLVLSLTNSVVQPLTANLLLAIGAVPAMLNDAEEAVDMLRSGTGALLVNLGTVTREQGAAMQTAVREANRLNIPWVLDPVAVGALSLRTRLAGQLKEQSPRIIRGNASEIMALAGYSSVTKGPESTSSSADALHAARELALHTGGGRARYGAYGLFHGRPPGNRHGKRPRHDVPGYGRGLFHGSPVRRLRRRLPHPPAGGRFHSRTHGHCRRNGL